MASAPRSLHVVEVAADAFEVAHAVAVRVHEW